MEPSIYSAQLSVSTRTIPKQKVRRRLCLTPVWWLSSSRWRKTPVIEGWLFGSPTTKRPYHRDSLHKNYLEPTAKKIDLPRLGWHDFRPTYRAMLRDLGLPLEVQQKLMRHSSIAMTARYGNSGMDETKREANRQLVEFVTQTQNGSARVVLAPSKEHFDSNTSVYLYVPSFC